MSFTSMHNDHLDPDRHNVQPEPPEAYQTVLDFFDAENEEQCAYRLYRRSACGAWITFTDTGILLGSIVEGADFGTVIYPLHYANNFTSDDIQARITAIVKEASAIWEWANVTKDKNGRRHMNGKTDAERGMDCPDVERDYNYETDGRSC